MVYLAGRYEGKTDHIKISYKVLKVSDELRKIAIRPQPRSFFLVIHMLQTILGIKLKQTQQFTAEGKRIPVTMVNVGPCFITRITDNSGIKLVQLGFGIKKNLTNAETGHLKKAGLTQKLRFLREFKVDSTENMLAGGEVKVADLFAVGDEVKVTGVSKGKGFAGVVKRHGFKGGPRTHGQSDRERSPGSIGQTTTPGRVYRGKRMAGRMGTDTVTVSGLTIEAIDSEHNTITIKGLVPGGKNNLLIISK